MKVFKFLIVVIFAVTMGCSPPLATLVTPSISVKDSTQIVFENNITVPATNDEGVFPFPDFANPFQLAFENSMVTIEKLRLENDSLLGVEVECYEREILVRDTIWGRNFITQDSTHLYIWQTIGSDTLEKPWAIIEKPKQEVQIKAMPKDGRFPFELIALSLVALWLWWSKKKKTQKEIS